MLGKRRKLTVRVEFPYNSESTFDTGAEEYIHGASLRAGLEVPSLCEQGWDLASAVKALEGEVDRSEASHYFEEDKECGFALPCPCKARSDLRIVAFLTAEMPKCRDEHGLPDPRDT